MEVRCYRVDDNEPIPTKESILHLFPRLLVQTVKGGEVRSEALAKMLVEQTLMAGSTNNLLARRPDVDLLLRLGGTTQISVAIASVGSKRGKPFDIIIAGDPKDVEAAERRFLANSSRIKGEVLDARDLRAIEKAALLNAARG